MTDSRSVGLLAVVALAAGIASPASADYSLHWDGGSVVTVEGADNDATFTQLSLIFAGVGAGMPTPTINYEGESSQVFWNGGDLDGWGAFLGEPAGAVKAVWVLALNDTVDPKPGHNGLLYTANLTDTGPGTVYLLNADASEHFPPLDIDVTDSIPGDADMDGDVDLDDFDILASNFYQAVAGAASVGDFNNDGVVNFDDYVIQAHNMPFGGPDEAIINTPEPAAGGVLFVLALAVSGRIASERHL